ncbi:flavodoxin domain-containing protein [Paraglaciecola aquimarina]|uniref:Flavodoxin domain-containing protein n=1 Tax=Paraglaciecola aquimarina TaxID=1235557 RepID=A0ABU3T1D8_9ALTE|nr:flavodoxin domain-containing protein [Paraglaciecola aquimarina]MDU0356086.1 flavodoxin domain-containing protein [Paraglaciecola aquimarina]
MSKVSIFVGTVYGNAQHVAEDVSSMLDNKGIASEIFMDPSVDDFKQATSVLMISSTTGQGDIPPNLEFFMEDLKDASVSMQSKPFAVAALGDSSYGESFCGAGVQIFELLTALQGNSVADLLEVDACETLEPEVEVVAWVEDIVEKLL